MPIHGNGGQEAAVTGERNVLRRPIRFTALDSFRVA
jgi:hypothetical protein